MHIHTHPCWISSLSFVTFLSSITVKDNEKTREMFSHRFPKERLSLMTANTQRLIASLMKQTTGKERQKQLSTYILPLFCGARRNRWGRTVLEKISWALWNTLRENRGDTSYLRDNQQHSPSICNNKERLESFRKWKIKDYLFFGYPLRQTVYIINRNVFEENKTNILYTGENLHVPTWLKQMHTHVLNLL